jgi:hypothetical protein
MNLNNLIGDLLSQKMVFYGDVLGLGMKYWILGYTNGTCSICRHSQDYLSVKILQVVPYKLLLLDLH